MRIIAYTIASLLVLFLALVRATPVAAVTLAVVICFAGAVDYLLSRQRLRDSQ